MNAAMSLKDAIAEASQAQSSPEPARAAGALMPALLATMLLVGIAVAVRGCFARSDDPFRYVQVSGKVCYEDGAQIPAAGLVLTFIPLETVSAEKRFARPGSALVAAETGEFQYATTRKPKDGIVFGRHRVVLSVSGKEPLSDDVVPAVYRDQTQSPLEVDTRNQPFEIRIKRPKVR